MLGEAQIYKLAGYLVLAHLIALTTAGCDSASITQTTAQPVIDEIDSGFNQTVDVQKIVFNGLPSALTNQSTTIIIEAMDAITGHRSVIVTGAQSTPFDLDLKELSLPVVLTAFVDLNTSQKIERCPFPAQSGQVITDTQYDLWSAQARLSRTDTEPLQFDFERAFCGAGSTGTTWSGNIDFSNTSSREGTNLFIQLTSIHDDGNATFQTLLNVDTYTGNSSDLLNVKLNALLPGRHELRAFWDDDHDLNFAPCIEGEVGGGDLAFSDLVTFEIVEGQAVQAVSTITLNTSTCTDVVTRINGRVDLSALTNGTARKLEGKLLVEVISKDSLERIYLRELNRNDHEEPSFTITNLPTIPLEVLVYLDRNGDEQLSSCAAVMNGQDLFSARPVAVTLIPEVTRELGVFQLEDHDCLPERLSNISLNFVMDAAGARKESPRPIYVSVSNEETNEVSLVRLTENHLALSQSSSLKLTLAPGNYTLFAFVDTEQDEVFSHCEYDSFGDRACTDLFKFQLSEYELFKADTLQVRRLGCDFPTVQYNLNVDMNSVPVAIAQMKIVINLIESGGLSETLVFDVPPVEPPWFFPVSDLVPGAYEVTVHLDQNGDRQLAECGENGLTEVVGHQSFVLNRQRPLLDASIELIDPCDESEVGNDE